MTRIAAMLAGVALAGCVTTPAPEMQLAAPGATVTLKVGEAAALQGGSVRLRFVAVIEDSRCPTDTTCVWAGEVKVAIEVLEPAKNPRAVELKMNENTTAAGHVITLLQVEPQPRSNVRIAANGYRATLKIE